MKVDYYKVLGIERTASETEIRQRFRQLAREYHPDRYRGRNKAEAEKTFQSLTEAVNVLTNPDRRRQHDAELPNLGKSQSDYAQVAKVYLNKGIKAYNEGDFVSAKEHFLMSVNHDPNDPKGFHYLALASSRNPSTMRQAVQAIEKAVALEPYNLVYLKAAGLLCKRAGLSAKAERYLEDALRWDAENQEIRSALDDLRKGRGESREGGKGLLDSLFKKS
jgi:curved DNA-binding protein CbpA